MLAGFQQATYALLFHHPIKFNLETYHTIKIFQWFSWNIYNFRQDFKSYPKRHGLMISLKRGTYFKLEKVSLF